MFLVSDHYRNFFVCKFKYLKKAFAECVVLANCQFSYCGCHSQAAEADEFALTRDGQSLACAVTHQ